MAKELEKVTKDVNGEPLSEHAAGVVAEMVQNLEAERASHPKEGETPPKEEINKTTETA